MTLEARAAAARSPTGLGRSGSAQPLHRNLLHQLPPPFSTPHPRARGVASLVLFVEFSAGPSLISLWIDLCGCLHPSLGSLYPAVLVPAHAWEGASPPGERGPSACLGPHPLLEAPSVPWMELCSEDQRCPLCCPSPLPLSSLPLPLISAPPLISVTAHLYHRLNSIPVIQRHSCPSSLHCHHPIRPIVSTAAPSPRRKARPQ